MFLFFTDSFAGIVWFVFISAASQLSRFFVFVTPVLWATVIYYIQSLFPVKYFFQNSLFFMTTSFLGSGFRIQGVRFQGPVPVYLPNERSCPITLIRFLSISDTFDFKRQGAFFSRYISRLLLLRLIIYEAKHSVPCGQGNFIYKSVSCSIVSRREKSSSACILFHSDNYILEKSR